MQTISADDEQTRRNGGPDEPSCREARACPVVIGNVFSRRVLQSVHPSGSVGVARVGEVAVITGVVRVEKVAVITRLARVREITVILRVRRAADKRTDGGVGRGISPGSHMPTVLFLLQTFLSKSIQTLKVNCYNNCIQNSRPKGSSI